MQREESIVKKLSEQFGFLDVSNAARKPRRIWIGAPLDKLRSVLEYAVKNLNFGILCTITGLDEGENFGFIYHLADENGIVLNLKTTLPKVSPFIDTITDLFACAEIYEREIVDLLGVKVNGMAEGNRYPLPDEWPKGQYPLRKDWDPDVLKKGEDSSDG